MYNPEMNQEPLFQAERLKEMMAKRDLGPGQLERLARMSRSQIYYLQQGEKPNVSAVIVGKLALVLGCSVDYLMGLTDDPTPASRKELPPELIELWEVYETLSPERRSDLLLVAEAFAEAMEEEEEDLDEMGLSEAQRQDLHRYRAVMRVIERRLSPEEVAALEEEAERLLATLEEEGEENQQRQTG